MKNIKKIINISILSSFLLITSSCNNNTNKNESYLDIKEKNIKKIEYEMSQNERNVDDSIIQLILPPKTNINTGDVFTINTKMDPSFVLPHKDYSVNAYFYYMVDWGDGTWSYNGPAMQDNAGYRSTIVHNHQYKKAGTYNISTAAYNLASETVIGWSKPQQVVVLGEDFDYPNMINKVSTFSSECLDNNHSDSAIIDNNNETYFASSYSDEDDIYDEKYVGMMFDKNYSLNKVEVKIPTSAKIIPSNISIEYTTDHGKNWYSLPRYYYKYDYAIGYYIIMNMENPKGATLVFDFDNICANGIRFISKLWPLYGTDVNEDRILEVSEMRAYGTERMLFYSSKDDTFNANLNNFWTIYGTADSEPRVFGSEYGEVPNATPFRTGFAMISTTEWLEWQSQKWAWVENEIINTAMMETIKETKYGSDGWSGADGFIWSTMDQQKHFNIQNHYDDNPIFISACKQYLFSGNFTYLKDINNNDITFFDLVNRDGQTMWTRLTKAMDYMLETMEGKTGLLVINDPENKGFPNSNASSYWDAFLCDGYLSAYCNILFYQSLLDLADIYDYRANVMNIKDVDNKATYYRELSQLVKEKFNQVFWNDETGRFIGSIDADGNIHDFGFTYVNFYACRHNIASKEHAKELFEWIDGKRLVESDTSTGQDIYFYKIAARVNTLDIASTGAPYYWWSHDGLLSCEPGEWAGWGQQQNGGFIFYTAHYDLMSRINYLGADDAFNRFNEIIDDFRTDQLRRYPFYKGLDGFKLGIIGEYPESGLVPLTFLTGFMGVTLTKDGLNIKANLPSDMDYAGCRKYHFGGRNYSIKVDKKITNPIVEKYENDTYYIVLPANKSFTITFDNRLIENKEANV